MEREVNNTPDNDILKVVRLSLWGIGSASPDRSTFEEMKQHTIVALPAGILSSLNLPADLLSEWQAAAYQQITHHLNYRRAQAALPVKVPYVILKGTAAAQYYPRPEFRSMGDIDIMTAREDHDAAYRAFLDAGYVIAKRSERETGFEKDGVMVELHRSFAKLNDIACAEYLDDLIIRNINPSHVLPDLVNGLVLLEHLSQHMVAGLGLRQVIDWMLFVNKCLPDEKWPEFREMARKTGMERLAVVTTRMCEMYLGLPERKWCAGANEGICRQLMTYVLNCGNFGNKRTDDRSLSENVLVNARGVKATFKLLQSRGQTNWKAAQKHPVLRPFAWVYQAGRYLKRGLKQRNAGSELKAAYAESKKRKALYDALGVRQDSKGLVVYRDGKYVKD